MKKTVARVSLTLGLPLLAAGLIASGGALAQESSGADTAISRERAEQIALEQQPGRVEESDIETSDGRTVWEVEIETEDGRDYEVKIDAQTGEVLEIED